MTEDAKDVILIIVGAITEAAIKLHGSGSSTPAWSKCILHTIAGRADPSRYYVCGAGLRDGGIGRHGEWLFDQTWYECSKTMVGGQQEHDPHRLEHLTLALESEWLDGDNNHLDDFLKLAVCVAETRVMIFQAPTIESAERSCRTMMDAARRVRTGTDADYLFACYVRQLANHPEKQTVTGIPETFPFRFWRTRLQGPLVPIPPA